MANVIGSPGNDSIALGVPAPGVIGIPTVGSDNISGGFGNDTIDGGGGADVVLGEFGSDRLLVRTFGTFDGGADADTYVLQGSPGGGTTIVDSGPNGIDVLDQNTATNITAMALSGVERLLLRGPALTMTMVQLESFTSIAAGGATTVADIVLVTGGSATTVVNGLATLGVTGSAAADTLIFTGTSNLTILGGGGNDSIRGNDGGGLLQGEDGNDTIDGGAGVDALNGGLGDDLYILRAGDSVLDIGGNNTVALAENPGWTSSLNMAGGIDTLRALANVFIADMLLSGVDNLAVNAFQVSLSLQQYDSLAIVADGAAPLGRIALTSGWVASTKTVTGLGTLEIVGSGVDDLLTLNSSGVTPTRFNVLSGFGNDSILTAGGADSIDGGAGNDTMDGFGGLDTLNGGAGNDLIRVRDGDKADGGDDDDRIQLLTAVVPVGSVSMDGGNGVDALFVNGTHLLTAANTVQNFETLLLNGATLTMTGAQFLDFNTIDVNAEALAFASSTVTLSSAAVMPPGTAIVVKNLPGLGITLANQANVLNFSSPNTPGVAFTPMIITGGTADDFIGGGNAGDLITGGGGNDQLFGWFGNDSLSGGDGIDQLWGEEGNDALDIGNGDSGFGGNGNDRFVITGSLGLSATLTGDNGTDTMVLGLPGLTLGAAVDIASDFEVLEFAGTQAVTMAGTHLNAFDSILLNGASGSSIALSSATDARLTASGGALLTIGGSGAGDRLIFTNSGSATRLTLSGNGGNDTLFGGNTDDTLTGGTEDDVLDGENGSDSLDGGAGNDTIDDVQGLDVMLGGTGNDLLVVRDGETARGGEDNDVIRLGGSMFFGTIDGGLGIDTLDTLGPSGLLSASVAVTGIERLALDASVFTLFAAQLAGIGTLVASAGGSQGALALADAATVTQAVDTSLTALSVTGSSLGDTLALTAGAGTALTLSGAGGNDSLVGSAGADLLQGGTGNDTIAAAAGDTVQAGEGDDLILGAAASLPGTVVLGGAGVDTFVAFEGSDLANGFAMSEVETLQVNGTSPVLISAGNLNALSTITGTNFSTFEISLLDGPVNATLVADSIDLILQASGLDDRLDFGATGALSRLVLVGGGGADSLIGGAAGDSLAGGSENDVLTGNAGADVLDGGSGNDLLLGGAGNDVVLAGDGDTVQAGDDDDRVVVTGSMATGTLDGGLGTDILGSGAGATLGAAVVVTGFETLAVTLNGFSLTGTHLAGIGTVRGSGAATLGALTITSAVTATLTVDAGLTGLAVTGSGVADTLTFTSGAGTAVLVSMGGGNDTLTTSLGADEVSGGDGNDSLSTGSGDDYIAGEAGVDRISAGAGADTILGGAGADRLRGGTGADVFRYEATTEGRDIIADFLAGTDRIAVSAAAFGGGLADGVALTAGQLVVKATNAATAPAGTGQFVFNTTSSTLLWDADGAGGAAGIAVATLTGVLGLATTDIMVVA